MIRNILVPRLKERFKARGLQVFDGTRPFARFPSLIQELDGISIYDDGDEATIEIEPFTHSHVSAYGKELSEREAHEAVADSVIDFLDNLFADRLLFWTSNNRRIGGLMVFERPVTEAPADLRGDVFVWSRRLR